MHVVISGWFWDRPGVGSGQYLHSLLHALPALDEGIRLTAIVPGEDLPDDAIPGVRFATRPLRGLWRRFPALGKVGWEQFVLPRAARELGADLLHVPYWAPPMSSPLPTVVTVHDLIPLLLRPYRGSPLVRLYTALVSAATPRADTVLTDSEASRRDIVAHLYIPPSRIRAILLAPAPSYRPEPASDDAEVRAGLGVGEEGYVLYLGGFDVRKNLRTLFTAFSTVCTALDGARLVVAGRLPAADTAFAPSPLRLAREAGVPEGALHFTDFVPETAKPALLRGARAFVYPSVYEGFGLPPLEAMACGVPVVGSCASSLPEVVGDAGVLTEPHDAAGMAGAIIRLLSEDDVYVRLRERAIRRAATFSWERTAAETCAAYRATLGGK